MTNLTDAAIKTVEWALHPCMGRTALPEDEPFWYADKCLACGNELAHIHPDEDTEGHAPDCPIPALGAAILREHHWFERRWRQERRDFEQQEYEKGRWPEEQCSCWLQWGIFGGPEVLLYCVKPRGHDDGAHEPREDEK